MYTCSIQSFKILASFCSWAGWFKSYLVENSWRHIFAWRGSIKVLCVPDWFKDCTEILRRYQRETLQHEQAEHDKRRQAIKEELKPTLTELEKHKNDAYKDFLKYIYEKHPPVDPNHKLDLTKNPTDDDFIVKYKALQRAIIHYHPDRVREAEHGLKAKVLNEEITKHLTKRYELVKERKWVMCWFGLWSSYVYCRDQIVQDYFILKSSRIWLTL